MPLNPQLTFSQKRVIPLFRAKAARQVPVPLAQGIYPAGTVLGQISSANVNDVQTITVSGTPTHSTVTVTGLPGGQTMTFAQDVSPAAMATAINTLLGASSVGVTGTYTAGSGGTYIITWGGSYAGQPIPLLGVSATFVGGTSPAVAIAHTTPGVGPNGSFRAYATGNGDGSQNAAGILEYPVAVDFTGAIWLGSVVGASEFGQSGRATPMYYNGDFAIADIVAPDTGWLAALNGHVVEGSLASGLGVVHIG